MSDKELVEKLKEAKQKINSQIHKIIVGQENVIEELLIALFSKGHCLIVGVPGLAKTLLVSTMAEILDLKFSRIQFTPDLMPSDITGTEVIEEDRATGKRSFRFIKGPIFANIILADEINRTPPKTQSALLEAMQEKKVTVGDKTYKLDEPFFVLATQNPIEQEGTYPLPEAQLDRFFFQIDIFYPDFEEEKEIVKKTTSDFEFNVEKILTKNEILELQRIVRRVPASEEVVEFAVNIVRKTRPEEGDEFIKKYVSWGAGPRASQTLIIGAKARAILDGRLTVSKEDIIRIVEPTLKHRIILNFNAFADGLKVEDVIQKIKNFF